MIDLDAKYVQLQIKRSYIKKNTVSETGSDRFGGIEVDSTKSRGIAAAYELGLQRFGRKLHECGEVHFCVFFMRGIDSDVVNGMDELYLKHLGGQTCLCLAGAFG